MRRRGRTNWYEIRGDVECALRGCAEFPRTTRISGRVTHLGTGVNHESYLFRVEADGPLPDTMHFAYVLRKITRNSIFKSDEEAAASLQNEVRMIQTVTSCAPDFQSPRLVCFVGGSDTTPAGFIETALAGLSLDQLKGRDGEPGFVPEAVARIAGAVHRLPVERFAFLERHEDSRAHVSAELGTFDADFASQDRDAVAAIAWIRDHLPHDRSAVVLHGDLLPQNLIWDIDDDQLGVIDWEFARIGDPAYDLAIVMRGRRKPLGFPNARRRLLEAYAEGGGAGITNHDVTNWELLMVLRWLADAVRTEREGRCEGHGPDHYRGQLRAILRRAGSGTRSV